MTRIDEIRERLDQITPGPWEVETMPETGESRVYRSHETTGENLEQVAPGGVMRADAEFIAHAPTDLAWCIDYIEVLGWVLRDEGYDPAYFTPESMAKN